MQKNYQSFFILCIIVHCIRMNETATCSRCKNLILGSASKNITYGPSDDHNCNCQWTIPTSMDTDDNTAVVLLLQNVSLPMTSGSGGSTSCSARIRFPAAGGYKCNFANNYCLTFATESTICTVEKIRDKILNFEHNCTSITPWNKAGESPHEILYNAGNFAGYTKFFDIQYLPIDCRDQTTIADSTTATTKQTPAKEISTPEYEISTPEYKITTPENLVNDGFETTTFTAGAKNFLRTTYTLQNKSETTTIPTLHSSGSTTTAGILGAVIGFILGLIVGVLSACVAQRYCMKIKTGNQDSTELEVTNQSVAGRQQATYENYVPTSDESGYEVPIHIEKKNERQYENVTNAQESQYEM